MITDHLFPQIDLFVFDVHTAPGLAAGSDPLRPELSFLADPQRYNQCYLDDHTVENETCRIVPLTARTIRRNRFWRRYLGVTDFHADKLDFWNLQIPFLLHPVGFDLQLRSDGRPWSGELRTVVFLNSLGWSTHLETRLAGEISAGELRDVVAGLRRGADPLLLDGRPTSVGRAFGELAEIVRRSVFDPAAGGSAKARLKPSDLPPQPPKFLVVSTTRLTGKTARYRRLKSEREQPRDGEGAELEVFQPWERAVLHSLLLGDKIDDLTQREEGEDRNKRFLKTDLLDSPADFCLTYFDQGTLLFLSRSGKKANESAPRRRINECLASNVRLFLMMVFSMHRFRRAASRMRRTKPALQGLDEALGVNLAEMPYSYQNPLCRHVSACYGKPSRRLG